MIFHISIEADEPERTARMMAEIWGGRAFPFPPVGRASWVAMAGDARNSTIEVYPRGTELHEAPGDVQGEDRMGTSKRNGPFHAAIATPLSVEEVKAIAARHGVPAKVLARGGGLFHVIEFWIDGCTMFELLTPEFQQEYLRAVTPAHWEKMLAAGDPPKPRAPAVAA
ncbi:MAG: hypothetical protein JWO81_331 [Alphaproteobacteria bacterium]|nr:hypothetical protein [Alphaproteobacteria bacterium]